MKIKDKKGEFGKNIKPTPDTIPKLDYPVFCLKYLQKDFCLDDCQNEDKISLIDQLQKLSQLTWIEIQSSHRHGLGSEKIKQNAIRIALPPFITPDITLIALRFNGKKAMVGYRSNFVFHILYLDINFTLYSH